MDNMTPEELRDLRNAKPEWVQKGLIIRQPTFSKSTFHPGEVVRSQGPSVPSPRLSPKVPDSTPIIPPFSDGPLYPYPGVGSATPYTNLDFYGSDPTTLYCDLLMVINSFGYSTDPVTMTVQDGAWNGFNWWQGTAMNQGFPTAVSLFVGNGRSGMGTGMAGIWVSPLGSLEPSVYMNMACFGSDIPTVQCYQNSDLFLATDAGGPIQINGWYPFAQAIISDVFPTTLVVGTCDISETFTPIANLTRTIASGPGIQGSAIWAGADADGNKWFLDYGISVGVKWSITNSIVDTVYTNAAKQSTPVQFGNPNPYGVTYSVKATP